MTVADELQLVRLQLHTLVAGDAPPTQVLNALRTLALLARLEERLRRLGRS